MNKKNRKNLNIYLSVFAVVAIIFTMFFSSICVHADGNPRLVDYYDISESIILNEDTDFPFLKTNNSNYSVITDFYNSTFNDTGFSLPSSVLRDVESCPHFVLICESSTDWKFILLPEDTFLVGNSSGYAIYVPVDNENSTVTLYGYLFDHYNTWQQTYLGYRNTQHWGPAASATVDGDQYYKLFYRDTTSAWGPVLNSDVSCYYSSDLNITSLSDLSDVNPNTSGSGAGSASREDMDNQAFLKQGSKMYLTNNTFNDGSLYVFPVFTDDQMKNPTNYSLRLVGSSSYGLRVRVNSPDLRAIAPVKYNGSDVGMIYGLYNDIPLEDFNASVVGNLSYDIPFSWFSSGRYTMSLSDLNKYCSVSGVDDGLMPLASGLSSTYGKDNNWQQFNSSGTMSFNVKNFNFSTDDFSLYLNDLIPTDAHYIINAYVVNNRNNYVSSVPMITLDFNLVTGEVVPIVDNTVSDGDILTSMAVDKLPSGYNNNNQPPSYYPGTITNQNPPSSSGGSSNSSSNSNNNIESGAIVINNNPTFNNENNNNLSSKENSGLIPFILGMITGNQKAGTTTIENATNTSGWLNIMNTTFSFVPVGVWNLLIGAFTAAIGIMIVSFILSIIIKFIT